MGQRYVQTDVSKLIVDPLKALRQMGRGRGGLVAGKFSGATALWVAQRLSWSPSGSYPVHLIQGYQTRLPQHFQQLHHHGNSRIS